MTTVQFRKGGPVHARTREAWGPTTLCGRYGDPGGGIFDLRKNAIERVTCRVCKRALGVEMKALLAAAGAES